MKTIAVVLMLCMLCASAAAEPADANLASLPADDATWSQLLIGAWCEDPYVGAGYGERWLFAEDELHILPSQYDEGDATPSICMWSVKDGELWVGPEDCSTPLELAGPYETPEDESPYSPMIQIEGKTFYQYSPDPAYFDDLG